MHTMEIKVIVLLIYLKHITARFITVLYISGPINQSAEESQLQYIVQNENSILLVKEYKGKMKHEYSKLRKTALQLFIYYNWAYNAASLFRVVLFLLHRSFSLTIYNGNVHGRRYYTS